MVEFYFIVRHIPWWSVPFIIVGLEFAYLNWLKKKKKTAYCFILIAFVGLISISFYVWAGGPDKSVRFFKKMHRDFQ